MAGKTLDLTDVITKDELACEIARMWHEWDLRREKWKAEKVELRKFLFATDTSVTSNSSLPWFNKTHIPKLCQIRDNLVANYMASLFPKRKWLMWEGLRKEDEEPKKTEAIKDYMAYAISQRQFKDEITRLIYDYIDYGNPIGTAEWVDESTKHPDTGEIRVGYVGPQIKRLNPLDVVMNPIAPNARSSPKIIRTMMSLGEAKKFLESETKTQEQKELATAVWSYLLEVREKSHQYAGDFKEVDDYFTMDGFGSFKEYLGSAYIEILSFVGDIYDRHSDTLYEKHVIHVIDRHKVVYKEPHPVPSGELPYHHAGWRIRQDNIWAMGPLDNLVGMQYRIDHVENLKADLFDLTVFPPLKIRGMVEDFEWGPFERIYVGDEGDVELMSPKADILQANIEIQQYEQRMEEMAGSPREAMGFRSPGEKTAFEVQRLENAASRIFQAKIKQFEEQILEPLLNEMLALARTNLTTDTIRVIDDEFKSVGFREITQEDLSAQGRLKPVAARHFAEKAELTQNLNNLFNSALGADPAIKAHFSSKKMAEMLEELLGFEDFEIVQDFVRLSEEQDAQRLINAGQEQTAVEAVTPAGIAEDDFDDTEV